MRRNAESLLVLAGIEPPRQWAAPVRLTDVIRAALGEVEDYQRVTVRGVEPATIIGSAAADLAHLLAELIENALVFSPPDQSVDIRGRNRPDGAYTLAIIDSGLGMPAGDVSSANRRLAGAESFTIAPSKYLGHYVAGNLAARHGIGVHLDNSPGNGITATIDIPPTLLTTDTAVAAPVTPPHGSPSVRGVRATGLPSAPSAPQVAIGGGWEAAGAPPPPAPGPAAPAPAPLPAAPTRTASGLVKRSRRGPDHSTVGATLDSDLLASLSNVTGHLTPRPADPPAAGTRQERPASGAPTGGAPWPPPPGAASRPSDPPLPSRPVGARSWPAPPAARPPAAAGSSGLDRPVLAPRRDPGSMGPAARPHGGPDATDPGATPGGLARRVRGAQLPTTQPLNVRRRQETQSAGPGGYRRDDQHDANGHMLGNGSTEGHANGPMTGRTSAPDNGRHSSGADESSAARSVYGFLTSFTQGVQRGLEEARRDPNTPKENS
jgi:hypothetical protein